MNRPIHGDDQLISNEQGGKSGDGDGVSKYLIEQPFMMFGGEQRKVGEVLDQWGKEKDVVVVVKTITRWELGGEEGLN